MKKHIILSVKSSPNWKKKLKYCDINTIKILKEKVILKYQRFLV